MSDEGRERRKFTRYKVWDIKRLIFQMENQTDSKLLVTLSLGGCSFFWPHPDLNFKPVRPVKCHFEMEPINSNLPGLKVELMGNLIYIRTLDLDGFDMAYFGVEFDEKERDKLQPIVDELGMMANEKKIQFA